jgi:hypothetical protein
MKTSKLIRITGDTAADVDAAIEMLCTSSLAIGISTQEEITEEIAEYMVTEVESLDWLTVYGDYEESARDVAISLVERLIL